MQEQNAMATDEQMSVMACQTTGNPKFNSLFSLILNKSLTLYDVYPSVSGGLPYKGLMCGKFPCHTAMFFSHVDIMWLQEYLMKLFAWTGSIFNNAYAMARSRAKFSSFLKGFWFIMLFVEKLGSDRWKGGRDVVGLSLKIIFVSETES